MRSLDQNTLRRFTTAFRMECRLTCLHWSYLLLHLLWSLILFANLSGKDLGTPQMILEGEMIFVCRTTISIVALFLAANSYARSIYGRFDDLENALPIGFEVLLGRWIACTFATILFSVEPLVLALIHGPIESLMESLLPFVVQVAIFWGFTTTFSWVLIAILGARRWVYLVFAAAWMGLLVLPGLLMNSRVPFVTLFNLTGNGGPLLYTEMYGTMPQGSLIFWFYLFYFGLMVTLMSFIGLRHIRRRSYRQPLQAAALVATGLALTLFAGGGYSQTVSAAQAQEKADSALYDANAMAAVSPTQAPETISAYDITLDLTNPAVPQFRVKLSIGNRGNEPLERIRLALHRDLKITQSDVPYERQDDFLTLTPPNPLAPGATLPVSLSYSGAIWHTQFAGGIPFAVDFVNEDGVSLSPQLRWYPIAGLLAYRAMPARFQLSISGADKMGFASNLPATSPNTFATEAAPWVALIGSPRLIQADVQNITLFVASRDLPVAQPVVRDIYVPFWAQVERFFPDIQVKGLKLFVLEFPPFAAPTLIDGWIVASTSRQMLTRSIPDKTFDLARFLTSEMIQPFFTGIDELVTQAASGGNGITINVSSGASLVYGTALFMQVCGQTNGDATAIQRTLDTQTNDTWQTVPEPIGAAYTGEQVATALNGVYGSGGEGAVIRVLRQLRLKPGEALKLNADQLAEWMKAAAHAQ